MPGISQLTGLKPTVVRVGVRNAEASAVIPAGSPVVLVMNGTNDGCDVVLPSTSSLAKLIGFGYGVASRAMNAGDAGEAVVYGFVNSVILSRQTRAASTDVWASEPARSVGEFLTINTTINFLQTAVSTIAVVTNATTDTRALRAPFDAMLAQTLASYVSSASSTADTRTAITAGVKAFVRLM